MWWAYVSDFFGAVFLTNAVPHFISGVCGRRFQSPFASPPGRGLSSPVVNVVWAMINALIGYVLLVQVGGIDIRHWADAGAFGGGVLLMGLFLARFFGRLHGGEAAAHGRGQH